MTGLDSADSITLRRPDGATRVEHTWFEDGIASYSRCELFGEIAFVETPAATFGAANACPSLDTTAWPGGSTITIGDAVDAFTDLDANDEGDVSGAAFDPNDPTVLWVVMNKGRLFKMHKVNGLYEAFPEYAGGLPLRFADGGGELDSEGVTVGPDGAIYVTSERDNAPRQEHVVQQDRALRREHRDHRPRPSWSRPTSGTSTTSSRRAPTWASRASRTCPTASWSRRAGRPTARRTGAASHKTPGLFAVAVEGTGDLHFFSLALSKGAARCWSRPRSQGSPTRWM